MFLYFTNYQLCYAHLYPGRLLCLSTFCQDDRSRNSDEISEKKGWDLYTSEFKLLTYFVEIDIYKINSKYTNTVTNEKKKKGKTSPCRLILWKMQIGLLKKQHYLPCAKPLLVVREKIVDFYKDSPEFNRLNGFETQSAATCK